MKPQKSIHPSDVAEFICIGNVLAIAVIKTVYRGGGRKTEVFSVQLAGRRLESGKWKAELTGVRVENGNLEN